MIAKKEDLINTYIENDHGELRDLYVEKAIEFGFSHQGYRDRDLNWYNLEFIGICEGWDNDRLGQTRNAYEKIGEYECKKLTLSDLKPRTRTEYEKVTESIFDLRDEFERGELYYNFGGNWFSYDDELSIATGFKQENIYRKIEKEIDERQEFIDNAYYLAQSCGSHDVEEVAGVMFDAGCRFVRANGEIE